MRDQSTDQPHTQPPAPRIRRRIGVLAATLGSLLLLSAFLAPLARASSATQLTAEPGQTPTPSGVGLVPEDCKGIAPTNGSANAITQKQLNDGQGFVKPAANSYVPGGTVHWLIEYNSDAKPTSTSFDIRDCVVEFLPGNSHLTDVVALVDTTPSGHGQIIVTGPASTPDVKAFDNVLDNAEFDFADNVALPGQFDLSWTVPADAPPGALICNYAKDTGGNTKGGKENRKAGACFTVQAPPTTTSTTTAPTTTSTAGPTATSTVTPTTTSTTSPSTTSTTSATPGEVTTTVPVTSTTEASTSTTSSGASTSTSSSVSTTSTPQGVGAFSAATTTTVPTHVLGEQFSKLATTGGATRTALTAAGVLMLMGGLLVLAGERRTHWLALRRR